MFITPPPPQEMNLNLEKFMKKWLNFIKISRLFSRKLKIQVTILEKMTQYRDVKILKNQILNLNTKKNKVKKRFRSPFKDPLMLILILSQ